MAFINERPSPLNVIAGIGTFVGLLLLGLAGISVVSSNAPVLKGALAKASGSDLARRLQFGSYQMGYITTTALPSSFDSSDSSSLGSSFEPSKSFDSLSSGSLPSLDLRIAWQEILKATGSIWFAVTATLALQSVFALLYYHKVVKLLGDDTLVNKDDGQAFGQFNTDRAGKFDNNILQCTTNRWVFLNGLCCPMVRQAHTNQVAGICGFWESLCCWCCCSWVTLGIGPSCLVMFWRVMIKATMKKGDDVIEDFCITCLCPELSVCQMANSVDAAMETEMTSCCALSQSSMGGYPDQGY